MHKFIKFSFLFVIFLFLFSTYSQSETDKPTWKNINIDSDLFKVLKKNETDKHTFKNKLEIFKKNQGKSTKRWSQPQDFKFLIPLAIFFFALIFAEKKNKLSESKEKSKHAVRFTLFFRDKNNKIAMRDIEDSDDAEPRIKGVQNACESYGHLEINDLILSINGNPTKTISDYITPYEII